MCSMTTPIIYDEPYGKRGVVPTLEEIKAWDFQNEVMKRWEAKH